MKNCGYEQTEEDSSARGEDLRRGPWTVEEDFALINYIARHGEGRWNSLSRCAGLKRTGKSCRLRWLNYLRPDVRRGNITLEEQLLILELHSRWGNRWSKIAQHLPGRTDNEIKNYWRTRVQKHAKQLKCDLNSKQFKDTMRYLWMPRLIERIQASSSSSAAAAVVNDGAPVMGSPSSTTITSHLSDHTNVAGQAQVFGGFESWKISSAGVSNFYNNNNNQFPVNQENGYYHAGNQLPYVVEQQQQEQQAMNGQSGYGYVNQVPELMDPSGGQWINSGVVADDWYLSDDINTWLFQPQDQPNANPLFSFS